MIYALCKKTKLIIKAEKGAEATCKDCGSLMIPKCGEINIHHWSHESKENCDSWSEGESEWHLYWKSLFLPQEIEQRIKKEDKWHRADILSNGRVLEIQHSPISKQEIRERELFYGEIFWLFDLTFKVTSRLLRYFVDYETSEVKLYWDYRSKTILSCSKPIFLHLKSDVIIYLTNKDLLSGFVLTQKEFLDFVENKIDIKYFENRVEEKKKRLEILRLAKLEIWKEKKIEEELVLQKKKDLELYELKKRKEIWAEEEKKRIIEYEKEHAEEIKLKKEQEKKIEQDIYDVRIKYEKILKEDSVVYKHHKMEEENRKNNTVAEPYNKNKWRMPLVEREWLIYLGWMQKRAANERRLLTKGPAYS